MGTDALVACPPPPVQSTGMPCNGSSPTSHPYGGHGTTGPPSPSCSPDREIMSVRLLMQGKEVGSLIGKKGDNIKKFREESGAKINISDGSTIERIVTITGCIETIGSAFKLVASKFEEDIRCCCPTGGSENIAIEVCLKLIVPASQCGCLIGKSGAKIKELKEMTGATVQVSTEMLPNSTERTVSVTGTTPGMVQCVKEICQIIQDSPPRGSTIPYRPRPLVNPMALAQAANLATLNVAQPPGGSTPLYCALPVPQPGHPTIPQSAGQIQPTAPLVSSPIAACGLPSLGLPSTPTAFLNDLTSLSAQQQQQQLLQLAAASAAVGSPAGPPPGATTIQPALVTPTGQIIQQPTQLSTTIPAPAQISTAPGSGVGVVLRPLLNGQFQPQPQQTIELTMPNELIGCIMGRGGGKINEIRKQSGATIKISNMEETGYERKVTISGTADSINLAYYLITSSIELNKMLYPGLQFADISCSAVASSPSPTTVLPSVAPSVANSAMLGPAIGLPAPAAAAGTFLPAANPLGGLSLCSTSAALNGLTISPSGQLIPAPAAGSLVTLQQQQPNSIRQLSSSSGVAAPSSVGMPVSAAAVVAAASVSPPAPHCATILSDNTGVSSAQGAAAAATAAAASSGVGGGISSPPGGGIIVLPDGTKSKDAVGTRQKFSPY